MKGAFQTSREIFENPIWSDVVKFRIFFFIVGNAVFAEEGIRVGDMQLERGQYLRSYRNLQKDLEYIDNKSVKQYSLSVLKRKIDQLVMESRLILKETELGTLFTVVNYALYQGFDNYKSPTKNGKRTVKEQQENSERTAEERQENNNNNVKNDKNVENGNKTPTRNKRTYSEDSSEYKMALYLHTRIMEHAEESGVGHLVRQANLQSWADDCRKILEIDKVDKSLVRDVIDWVTKHEFWKTNILSAKTLRDKMGSLAIKMKSERKGASNNGRNEQGDGGNTVSTPTQSLTEMFTKR